MADLLDFGEMNDDCDSAEQQIMKLEELLAEKERGADRSRARDRAANDRLARKYNLPN